MIDKRSGKVAYAVVSFGGFLGMGEDYYPMPWSKLDYDTSLGGYRVDITEDQLKGAIGIGLIGRVIGRCTTTIIHPCGTVGRRAVHILCLIQKRVGSDILFSALAPTRASLCLVYRCRSCRFSGANPRTWAAPSGRKLAPHQMI
jgi:PRC-barrel domain protein